MSSNCCGCRVRIADDGVRAVVHGLWLMDPVDGSLLVEYRCAADVERAVRDFNRTGRAESPAHYARQRRKRR